MLKKLIHLLFRCVFLSAVFPLQSVIPGLVVVKNMDVSHIWVQILALPVTT